MTITIDQIKKLREMTSVSMMACKKALEEANGDFEKSIDILRKKGEAKAVSRAEKSTANGIVVIKSEDEKSALVELLCETDFVARNEDFLALGEKIADMLLKGKIKPEDKDIPELKDTIMKMNENIKIEKMKIVKGKNLGNYVHSNKKIGVVVSLSGGDPQLAKDIAMQIAATNPQVISPKDVSQKLVDKEKEIWTEQLKKENKPENIIEKIMMGKEKKFREENALLTQAFVKDPEKTVEQLLKTGDAMLEEFERFSI